MLKTETKTFNGIYYEGPGNYLVVTPEKTKTYSTSKLARYYFNKWIEENSYY